MVLCFVSRGGSSIRVRWARPTLKISAKNVSFYRGTGEYGRVGNMVKIKYYVEIVVANFVFSQIAVGTI